MVADEVRSLARRTQDSTGEIEKMITHLRDGVGASVRAMDASQTLVGQNVSGSTRVRSSLENILDAIAGIADQSRQISTSAEQQTVVAVEIDQHVQQISEAAEHTAAASQHAQSSSHELAALVQRLNAAMSAFRV